jgi:hypothetical protein
VQDARRAETPLSEDASPVLALERIYAEVRTGIRETDSISFKLLGLVPLVSGAALIGLILKPLQPASGAGAQTDLRKGGAGRG